MGTRMKSKKKTFATLHQRILTDIEKRIMSGDWPPGFRLPFEIQLAQSYDVSRMTVNKVLTKLASAGLIERRKKSGTFVAQPQVQPAILEIHDIEQEVRQIKQLYTFKILCNVKRKSTGSDLASFGLSKKGAILEISCLHFAGEAPFCYEDRLINLDVVPKASDVDFAVIPPGQWLRLQVPWSTAEHKIYAAAADSHVASQLGLEGKSACLVIQRRTWSEQGPVTFVRFTYPAKKHAIVARFTPASGG